MTQVTVKSWVNGEAVDSISVFDRGLQYGDGFFTSVLVVGNTLLNWPAHWRRIQQSANRLQFAELNESLLLQQITAALLSVADCLPIKTQVLKVIITRGQAGRGYPIPENAEVMTIIQLSDAPLQVESQSNSGPFRFNLPHPKPISIRLCSTQASVQAQLAGIKHLNRLDNVLARTEVVNLGQEEGLMLNAFGFVVSGTQSNLFMIKGKQLLTPKLNQSGVEGTTRYQLSKMAADLGFSWQETDISVDQLKHADELFLANAVRGIMPIGEFEGGPHSVSQSLKIHQVWSTWQANNVLCLDNVESEA